MYNEKLIPIYAKLGKLVNTETINRDEWNLPEISIDNEVKSIIEIITREKSEDFKDSEYIAFEVEFDDSVKFYVDYAKRVQ